MSSWAEVASHGPVQTEEEKKAHAVPIIISQDSPDTTNVVDESHSINVVPADFKESKVQTSTQVHGDHIGEAEAKLREDAAAALEASKKETKKAAKKAENVLLTVARDQRTYGVIDAVVLVALGMAAYRRYKDNALDWKTASVGVAGLGLFATAQGFVQS